MIALASDHGGYLLKEIIKKYLTTQGYQIVDFGTTNEESCDYPDFAAKAAWAVYNQKCESGILICGTGIGMSLAAGKVPAIRAAVVSDCFSAKMSRAHNDANILCLGQRVVGEGLALNIVDIWLSTAFEGGRHQRRIDKIHQLEGGQRIE